MTQIDTVALKSRIDLLALFSRDGNVLRKTTGHSMCVCPFHREKTPSCHIWADHYYCFGCNARGDAITYIRQTRGKTFPEAIELLGGTVSPWRQEFRPPPTPPVEEKLPETDFRAMARWFSGGVSEEQMEDASYKLGVSSESLWWLGMGWCEESRAWSFPMHDGDGRVIGIRLRTSDGKKFAVTGSRSGIFLPSIEADRRLFIMEGPTDTAAALTLGFYGIGRPSCNGSVEQVLTFLKRNRKIREVVLVTDNDSPGITGADALRQKIPLPTWQLLLPTKDIRRYCQVGGSRKLIESMIHSQLPKTNR